MAKVLMVLTSSGLEGCGGEGIVLQIFMFLNCHEQTLFFFFFANLPFVLSTRSILSSRSRRILSCGTFDI